MSKRPAAEPRPWKEATKPFPSLGRLKPETIPLLDIPWASDAERWTHGRPLADPWEEAQEEYS